MPALVLLVAQKMLPGDGPHLRLDADGALPFLKIARQTAFGNFSGFIAPVGDGYD